MENHMIEHIPAVLTFAALVGVAILLWPASRSAAPSAISNNQRGEHS
jgi:hypothetical protein